MQQPEIAAVVPVKAGEMQPIEAKRQREALLYHHAEGVEFGEQRLADVTESGGLRRP